MAENYAYAPSKLKSILRGPAETSLTINADHVLLLWGYEGTLVGPNLSFSSHMFKECSKTVQVWNCVSKNNSWNSGDIQFLDWVEESLMEKKEGDPWLLNIVECHFLLQLFGTYGCAEMTSSLKSMTTIGIKWLKKLNNNVIPWRVIRCEPVRVIRIGGLYAQKVKTFAGGLCDSSFVSLYSLRLIESVNLCAYSGLLRISPALQEYLINSGVCLSV
ncbi:hypothetical protein LguiA_025699 [Lonicera macranthoides]